MLDGEVKIFRDNVHGYIEVPKDYVDLFIDTEIFQRLRNIEQTGMRVLYPSARHDRFIHSLGTYHLGHKAFCCFRKNVKKRYSDQNKKHGDHYHVFKDTERNEKFWDKCGILFEIACLLHDCGHAPFSHTLEFYYEGEQYDPNYVTLKEKLKEFLCSQEFDNDYMDQGSEHERMSALVVCAEFGEKTDRLIQENGLETEEGTSNIEFISRMILGCEYSRLTAENQIRNCLINLLNSSSIDVDSLDYIIRDSKLSGIDNMSVDIERLLGSLGLVEVTSFEQASFSDADIHANILNGVLKGGNGRVVLKGGCKGAFTVKGEAEGKIGGQIALQGNLRIKNPPGIKPSNSNRIIVNGASYENIIPPVSSDSNMVLSVTTTGDIEFTSHSLEMKENFNGRVNISAQECQFAATYVDAKMNGIFSGDILGNFSRIRGGMVRCLLGFHKSSLGIIQNVLVARNYEYQWIYSHHKVVYSANYLIIELLRSCIRHLNQKEKIDYSADNVLTKMLSWSTMLRHKEGDIAIHTYELGGQKFFRPSDSDIIALFKKCRIDCIEKNSQDDCAALLEEYYTRKFKKSLWKSYAEFNIFFNDFSSEEKSDLYKLFLINSERGIDKKYGYFKEDWERAFEAFGMRDVVWVNGNSKLKDLDADNTFIIFEDSVLTYRTVREGDTGRDKNINLFYLYYNNTRNGKPIDTIGLKEFIKDQLRYYPKNKG